MEGIRHPFLQDVYEPDGTGAVRITTPSGSVGRYRADGSWLDGGRFDVDPQLCGWVAGPRASHRLARGTST